MQFVTMPVRLRSGAAGPGEGRRGEFAEQRPVAGCEAAEFADPPAIGDVGDGAGVVSSRFEVCPDAMEPQAQHMIPGRFAQELHEDAVQRAAGGAGGCGERIDGDRLGEVGGDSRLCACDDPHMAAAGPSRGTAGWMIAGRVGGAGRVVTSERR